MYCKLYDIEDDKIFIDKSVSGKSTDRIEYYKMIIVYKNYRIHRSVYNLLDTRVLGVFSKYCRYT
ncbi:recombinase family protein (plasmid) [Paraclostridium sordellii]|uniref:recombinase family protein n=1 Tax=Paraclostridium sordellii TaxID=1505 RepID=UPI0006DCF7C8